MCLTYDSDGNLNPGIHKIDISVFAKFFVHPYSTSRTRKKIFNGYCEYCKILSAYNFITRQWIYGSYITTKLNPNDISFVNIVDGKAIEINKRIPFFFEKLKSEHDSVHEKFDCDCYFVTEYPQDDYRYEMFKNSIEYYTGVKYGLFNSGIDRVKKGIVELKFSSLYFEVNVSGGVGDCWGI